MNEATLVALVPVRIFVVLGFCFLYVLGGRAMKGLFRRLLGSAWLTVGTIGLSLVTGSFKWWLLLAPSLYFAALSVGYGADSFLTKVARRAVFGAFLGACSLIFAASTGCWGLAGFQIALAAFGAVALGAFNPVGNAVGEEALISLLAVACVPFMV
jgi:hypothetical protein